MQCVLALTGRKIQNPSKGDIKLTVTEIVAATGIFVNGTAIHGFDADNSDRDSDCNKEQSKEQPGVAREVPYPVLV